MLKFFNRIINPATRHLRIAGASASKALFSKLNEPYVNIFISTKNDINFNLATEDLLFEHWKLTAPTLFLYRNDKAIIIGKHQNPWKECWIQ